jgi:hypothetical protein
MPKFRNMGGEGGRDSTQPFYLKGKKKYYNHKSQNYKLEKKDLENYFTGNEIECLECGNWYKSLTKHIGYCHRMTKDEYCIKHGIPLGKALNSRASSDQMRHSAKSRLDYDEMTQKRKTNLEIGHKLKKEPYIKREHHCPECLKSYNKLSNPVGAKVVICSECRRKKNIQATLKYQNKNNKKEKHKCNFCKKNFETKNRSLWKKAKNNLPVYCSLSCASKFTNMSRKKTFYFKNCPQCKKSFKRSNNKSTYCSLECYRASGKALEYAKKNGLLGGQKRVISAKRDKDGNFTS